MDARAPITVLTSQLPRPSGRAGHGGAVCRPPVGQTIPQASERSRLQPFLGAAETFKKTPYAVNSKPAGPDLAQQMLEVDSTFKTGDLDNGGGPIDAASGDEILSDVNLIVEEPAARQTIRALRATYSTFGVPWMNAQQVGPAIGGAAPDRSGAHEKQCYADV